MANSRSSKGRRKIEMKKIESEDARHVTFSKRRTGVFNKASELATLCGVDIGLVVYSPAGRPYSFGQPSADVVFDRFLAQYRNPGPPGPAEPGSAESHQSPPLRQLSQQCSELLGRLAAEKSRRAGLEGRLKVATQGNGREWANGFERAKAEELEGLARGLEEQKAKADARVREILESGASSSRGPMAGATMFVNPNPIPYPDMSHMTQFQMAPPPPQARQAPFYGPVFN